MDTGSAPAQIIWDEHGEPTSQQFGDIYFTKDQGLAESRYVFLDANELPARFSALNQYELFVIGETGFGTGLNFLAAWDLWLRTAPATAQLHFISAEKFPLTHADLTRALALWPQLAHLVEQLLAAYPPVFSGEENLGYFRCCFSGNVHLTLIFDDATRAFAQFKPEYLGSELMASQNQLHLGGKNCAVNAWFLDGFAPSKNPSMWHAELFLALANLSVPGTTLATFTVAGIVKRGLAAAGFNWQKQPGFGRKKAMLTATRLPFSRYFSPRRRIGNQWHLTQAGRSDSKRVLIIGGGMAGCHCAYALARRGYSVTLAEQNALASGGSGNAQGIVYTTLSHTPGPFADFNLVAFLYACQFYKLHNGFQRAGGQTGLIDLMPDTAALTNIIQRFAGNSHCIQGISAEQATAQSGVKIDESGLFYPTAGWLNPPKLCRLLTEHANVNLQEFSSISTLEYLESQWHTQLGSFDQVVIAAAQGTLEFESAQSIRLKSIRGQVTIVEPAGGLKTVLCGDGYIAPAQNGLMSTGASFNPKSTSLEILAEDRAKNLSNAALLSNAFADLAAVGDRASLRCVTPDYLPVIGPLPKPTFLQQFSALKTNRNADIDTAADFYPQLYCVTGLGSRGLTYSPIAAEIITALITGAPSPISTQLWKFVHPARFWVRDLIRG
jgi:tRNA 5-methylaminomethyl-2-thiouridine biosynthesis bifunctional protein